MSDDHAAGSVQDIELAEAVTQRYLTYAVSTIVGRSLPDARDGLKPVHRRLLYAMRQLRLDPASGFKKCARVVGDVIGRYHPHGDAAVYEAMVRLAQDFAVRYPLVEGQGNFGNIDGDGAAAMRYTEARLTAVAEALLDGLDENATDFRPTYDGEDDEPVVLPAAFPNLLANGATGIAVGMATSIPPHNAGELCTALVHLLDHPEATVEDLLALIPGPDFPTGGLVVEDFATRAALYRTGRGSLRLRARWHREEVGRSRSRIVVTEIPYQVQKAKLIEQIAALLADRKLPALSDVCDESTDLVRLVLEPRDAGASCDAIMHQLFRMTDLETRVGINMNVLVDGTTPRVLGLRDLLQVFLDHRRQVLLRRSRHRIGQIDRRLEVLDGLLIVHLNIDAVIKVIREADSPKPALMQEFALTETQADAVLNMRLRQLNKLEGIELQAEHDRLTAEKAGLQQMIGDEQLVSARLADEIGGIGKAFGGDTPLGRRRTTIVDDAPGAMAAPLPAVVAAQPITIVCSAKEWLKAIGGHDVDPAAIRYKEGDTQRFVLTARTSDRLMVFAANGRSYALPCDKLPSGRGFGEPLRLMLDLPAGVDLVSLWVFRPEGRVLVATASGRGFVAAEAELAAQTRSGRQVLLPADGDVAAQARCIQPGHDAVAAVGSNRHLLIFPLADVPQLQKGRGVILQRYRNGQLAILRTFCLADGIEWQSGKARTKRTDLATWSGKRAQTGYPLPRAVSIDQWPE